MSEAWYRDPATRALIARRYLPALLLLNLLWELFQLPLYTIWREASPGYIAFAVAHCTAGDSLIGLASLGIALIASRAGPFVEWEWAKIAVTTTIVGASYTILSEWLNTSVRQAWQYSELMPTLEVGGLTIGLSPLAQWLVLPAIAVYLSRSYSFRPPA